MFCMFIISTVVGGNVEMHSDNEAKDLLNDNVKGNFFQSYNSD